MDPLSPANTQRKLKTLQIEEILKKILPLPKDKALSKVAYRMGMKEKTAREYLKLICAEEKIDYDKAGLLEWKKR